jgi:hypothetical protein
MTPRCCSTVPSVGEGHIVSLPGHYVYSNDSSTQVLYQTHPTQQDASWYGLLPLSVRICPFWVDKMSCSGRHPVSAPLPRRQRPRARQWRKPSAELPEHCWSLQWYSQACPQRIGSCHRVNPDNVSPQRRRCHLSTYWCSVACEKLAKGIRHPWLWHRFCSCGMTGHRLVALILYQQGRQKHAGERYHVGRRQGGDRRSPSGRKIQIMIGALCL